jgi:hypothetical protein
MLTDDVLRICTFTGERLEEEVEKVLVKHGETILDDTGICVLRQIENSGNPCCDCPSFIGCKKKYMVLAAVTTLPFILIAEFPPGERKRIYIHTLNLVERILRARTDEELAQIVPGIQ